jgi:hypothetical protein
MRSTDVRGGPDWRRRESNSRVKGDGIDVELPQQLPPKCSVDLHAPWTSANDHRLQPFAGSSVAARMEVAKTPPSAKSDSDRNRHCLKRRATLWRACRPEPSLMASTGRGLRAKDTQICTAFSFRDTPMKTTLDLDDTLLARARALAARQRSSLTRLIEEGL